eukprot:4134100-Prymnesium_polylepis.2
MTPAAPPVIPVPPHAPPLSPFPPRPPCPSAPPPFPPLLPFTSDGTELGHALSFGAEGSNSADFWLVVIGIVLFVLCFGLCCGVAVPYRTNNPHTSAQCANVTSEPPSSNQAAQIATPPDSP